MNETGLALLGIMLEGAFPRAHPITHLGRVLNNEKQFWHIKNRRHHNIRYFLA